MASMICHCRTCQRVAGAPVVAWITVKPATLTITKGKPKRYASSAKVERQFCGACGAQLTYRRTTNKRYIDIATATLDDPDALPPTHHSWLSHDIGWVKFGDRLPKFPKSRTRG
ncbi:MAG: GFA family protein [Hyphomonadaceae bacterium]